MRKKLSAIIIFIGVLFIFIPIIGNLYTSYKQDEMVRQFKRNITNPELSANKSNPYKEYNQLERAFASEKETGSADPGNNPRSQAELSEITEKDTDSYQDQKMLGIIKVSKISIELPIVEGVEQRSLRTGIGHIPGTALPGEAGNCVLAGHRSYTFGKFFNQLDKLEKGNEININNGYKSYTYKVFKTYVVSPDDTSILEENKNENIITLVTCTPIYVASHRLIVVAKLVE